MERREKETEAAGGTEKETESLSGKRAIALLHVRFKRDFKRV